MNKNSKNGIEPKKNGTIYHILTLFGHSPGSWQQHLEGSSGEQFPACIDPCGTLPGGKWGVTYPEKVSSWEVDLRFGTGSEIFGDLSKIHDICVAWDQRLWDFFCVQLRFVFSWDWMSLCNFKCQFAIWTQPAAPENMFLQEINPPSTPLKLLVLNYCCGYLRGRSLLTSIIISV